MPPDFTFEQAVGGIVVGLDEVGRGPLAGPVVAAAVILDPSVRHEHLDDSKKLTAKRREVLAVQILATATVGIGQASVEEIDRLNILNAAMLAMERAYAALGRSADAALVDGNRAPKLPCPVTCIVKGDGKSLSIAAASVVAKVHRDRIMTELAKQFPGFGWESNAGYGSAQHLVALARLGPTIHHRRSFAPVREAENRAKTYSS